jgi:ribosomal protein S13
MKFEQLLQVYWSKGFYFAGRMRSFNTTIESLFNELRGLGQRSKTVFIRRFEFGYYKYKTNKNIGLLPIEQRKIINMYFGQLSSVSHEIDELTKYNLIRLYLIKSFRGKAQAIGKPSRGQRTWSNAWTAYKLNTPLKQFVSEMKKIHFKTKVVESKNKKILKKKIKINLSAKPKVEKIKNTWF